MSRKPLSWPFHSPIRAWMTGARHIPGELPLDRWQRESIAADARRAWLCHGRNGLLVFAGVVVCLALFVLGVILLRWLENQHGWPRLNSPFGLVVTLGASIGFVCWRERTLPRFVFKALRDRGHDVCLGCGYLRSGLDTAISCPECGVTQLDPVGRGGP